MADYKRLEVWQKAHATALECHKATTRIRNFEYLSLKSQINRSAFSVPTNIVEGNGQASRKEFIRFLRISVNSSNELEYHLVVARDLRLLPDDELDTLVSNVCEVRKMIYGLIRYLQGPPKNPSSGA